MGNRCPRGRGRSWTRPTTWILLSAAWLVVSVALTLTLGEAARLADRRAAEERHFTLLEAEVRAGSSRLAHGLRTSTAG